MGIVSRQWFMTSPSSAAESSGLATSRELLQRHPRLKLANVEKEDGYNKHQTGRNSGVIHSGIYYKPGSLKAKLCVEGRKLAWAYCDAKKIPYKKVGQADRRHRGVRAWPPRGSLDSRAAERDRAISKSSTSARSRARAVLPRYQGDLSPVTGIVDWGVVAAHYAEDAREAGADMYLGPEVRGIDRRGGVTAALHEPRAKSRPSTSSPAAGSIPTSSPA